MQLRSTTVVTLSISAVLVIAVAGSPREYRNKEVLDKCIAQENATFKDIDDYPHNLEILGWHPKESTLCAFKCMALDAMLIQETHIHPSMLKRFAALYDKVEDSNFLRAKYCLSFIKDHKVHTCQDMEPVMNCLGRVMPEPMDNAWDDIMDI